MRYPRLIPVLIQKEGGLYKSENFTTWTYVGDILNTIKIFNEKEVDEILILSVDKRGEDNVIDYNLLTMLAEECFMPISYGGGIRCDDHARRIVDCGIDRVVLNSSIREDPILLSSISKIVGSSSTIASIDAVKIGSDFFAFDHVTHRPTSYLVGDLIARFVECGAGEVMVQSVERDGARTGPDLELAKLVSEMSSVPSIYVGGVTSMKDVTSLWERGVDAIGAGSWFVFNGHHKAVLITYPRRKSLVQAIEAAGPRTS